LRNVPERRLAKYCYLKRIYEYQKAVKAVFIVGQEAQIDRKKQKPGDDHGEAGDHKYYKVYWNISFF
jgi:hypothetical protein